MQLQVSEDTTTPSYWLNWRFLLCAILVLASVLIASFLIRKYEHSGNSESERGETQQEGPRILRYDESWKPCLKEIHPVYLVVYRMIAFCLLLVTLSFDVATSGVEVLLYYTHWTLTLATIYFGVWTYGSFITLFLAYIRNQHKGNSFGDNLVSELVEQGLFVPLAHGVNEAGVKLPDGLECPGEQHCLRTAGLCGYLFQILFQLKLVEHSLNAILLLGDTALNSSGFPWHRISFFMWLTTIYVVFQWTLHAYVSIWWPYPILDLSLEDAPLWYLVVALVQIPCYAIFVLLVKIKHLVLSKWFAQSYQFCP